MPRNRDEYDDELPRPRRRETIMEHRLRVARGEIDDRPYDYDQDEDQDYAPVRPRRPLPVYAPPQRSSGCAQAVLYLVLGGLVALLVAVFFFNNAVSGIGTFFTRGPQLPAIMVSPTPTIRTNAAVIQRLQQLNRLETTSYTIETVIEAGIEGNVWEDLLFGDRLLLIAHGTVVAGVDLSELRREQVVVSADGQIVQVVLPPVRIFGVNLDNSRTRVYDRQQGFLAQTNKDLETAARQAAEAKILQAACEGGVLEQATEDSERALQQLLSLLEFQQIEVIPSGMPSCQVSTPTSPAPVSP